MTAPVTSPQAARRTNVALLSTFFVSGVPALIYQLVWQRALFSIYGVNIEAITVVVAAFMLGLGIGSLMGGVASARSQLALLWFAGLEFGIGAFGLNSLEIFDRVGKHTLGAGTFEVGALTFGLVLLPTCLMGATLPLLVSYLVRRDGSVGRSLGTLYFVNTLGSAVACFACALVFLPLLGMHGAVRLAAVLNGIVGTAALLTWLRGRGASDAAAERRSIDGPAAPTTSVPFALALVLSGMTGFIALSYEIIWARVFGYASRGSAHSFPLVLGCYLLGIALGSTIAGQRCERQASQGGAIRSFGWLIIGANVCGLLLAPALSVVSSFVVYAFGFPLLVGSAMTLGAMFPYLGHLSVSPDDKAGSRVSYLYVANIAGSTMGSLITGFILMDHLSIGLITVAIAGAGLALGAAVLWLSSSATQRRWQVWVPTVGAAAALLVCGNLAHTNIYDRLLFDPSHAHGQHFSEILENKHGVIAVSETGRIYGGGAYDGVFSTDLVEDRNILIRPFALSAFHAAPKRILTIGLASGSWAQVLVNHPALERLTIIEINPGYLDLIPKHPEVANLLRNPKVEIIIDDGRRWLLSNANHQFDAVVMNATYHWRSHMTNLLSAEFLELIRSSLAPGGIALINSTWSDEVQRTVASVFPYAKRFLNSMVFSDSPLVPDRARWEQALLDYRIEGHPVIDVSQDAHRRRLKEILATLDGSGPPPNTPFETRQDILKRTEGLRTVTDDNMVTEWLKVR